MSRAHNLIIRVLLMCVFDGFEDVIADLKPSTPVACRTQTSNAKVCGHEWEVEKGEIIAEGLAAPESNDDEMVCVIKCDVAGCIG
jgi:hypothetical protein